MIEGGKGVIIDMLGGVFGFVLIKDVLDEVIDFLKYFMGVEV